MTTAPVHDTPTAAALRRQKEADQRKLMTNKDCMLEGGWGQTTQLGKVAEGVLHRVNVGTRAMVTAESFWDHLIDLANAPPRKIRQPTTRFQKRPRPRTERELEGLKRGNAQRREEAAARRASREAI